LQKRRKGRERLKVKKELRRGSLWKNRREEEKSK